mmetsp:Transcript_52336/g.61106  ORF Transcript_52336/g.61106 Transcript_52336/m.61106 type:complete len:257 (-) Transcript_52336:1093-1863(-)
MMENNDRSKPADILTLESCCTRMPAISAATLSTMALLALYASGRTCRFLKIVSLSANSNLIMDATENYQFTNDHITIGILCEVPYIDAVGDLNVDQWTVTISRLLLGASVVVGFLCFTISWAISGLIIPSHHVSNSWKTFGYTATVCGVLQIAATILIFSSDFCQHEELNCQVELGTFLLVCSSIFYLSILFITQYCEPPFLEDMDTSCDLFSHDKTHCTDREDDFDADDMETNSFLKKNSIVKDVQKNFAGKIRS